MTSLSQLAASLWVISHDPTVVVTVIMGALAFAIIGKGLWWAAMVRR